MISSFDVQYSKY